MATNLKSDYQLNYARYKHYYRQIWKFYQQPAAKVSTALLLTVFTTVFFAVFAIKPTLVTVAELLKTIEDQEEVLSKLKKKAASLASAQQEYALHADAVEKLNQAIPNDKDIQGLIENIEATAADHQLAIETIRINEFEYRTNQTLPDSVTIPFSLSLDANYVELKDFLHDLLRLPRFISIDTISLAEDTEAEVALDSSSVRLSIRVNAHYMPLANNQTVSE